MDVHTNVIDRYYTEGVMGVIRRIPAKVLDHSLFAPTLHAVLGDEFVRKCVFFGLHGYWPQFNPPRSFNEKIYYRKMFTDEPLYTRLADKAAVREYVRERVGGDVLTEVYHVTDDPATIPFEDLPDSFVLKSTHGSGQVAIVENKRDCEFDALRAVCNEWLEKRYGENANEYWYGRISPGSTCTIRTAKRCASAR